MPKSLTRRELEQLILAGENQYLEFKRVVPDPPRLAKEMIAFANSGGGTILIGIDDDGSIVGLKDHSEEVFAVSKAARLHCAPKISYQIDELPVSRKRDVLLVRVPPSTERPHFLIDPDNASLRKAFVRVDDMSVQASKESVRLMKLANRDKDVTFEFGDKELMLMRYLDEYGRITVIEFARLANIPKKSASHTLVLMTSANVLSIHPRETEDFFTLRKSAS